jgi:hypothetical protein
MTDVVPVVPSWFNAVGPEINHNDTTSTTPAARLFIAVFCDAS